MNDKRKAIIHIGAPKTGTTSIQTFCYKNRKYLLEKYSIYYPDHEQLVRPESGYGHHYIAFHIFRDFFSKITPSHINLDITLDILREVLSSQQAQYLLISCEGLLNLPYSSKFQEFISIIKQFYDELYIILYVRRQDELILSACFTNVMMGLVSDINKFINSKIRDSAFDFYKLVKLYEKANFKVFVRPYDRSLLLNQDIVTDFIYVLEKITNQKIDISNLYKKEDYTLNVTMPYFITQLVAYYNQFLPSSNKTIQSLKKLGRYLIKLDKNLNRVKFDLVPPSKRFEILKHFEESNTKLSQEYLNLDGLWYEIDLPVNDEEWNKENKFPGSALYHLCKAILKILENK